MANESEIIFTDADGRELRRDDLRNYSGMANFALPGHYEIPDEAAELHQQAREIGAGGDYDQSIALLLKAHEIAPEWPYPLYDLAFTYLLKQEDEEALKYYRKVDAMEPRGFFTVKTALHALEGEAEERFPRGIYLAYLNIEWTQSPEEQYEIAHELTRAVPSFAPAWKELALKTDDVAERLKLLETALELDCDSDLRGNLLANKALCLHAQGDERGAIDILGAMVLAEESEQARQFGAMVLRHILEE